MDWKSLVNYYLSKKGTCLLYFVLFDIVTSIVTTCSMVEVTGAVVDRGP